MKRIIAMSILILLLTAIVSACENSNQLYEKLLSLIFAFVLTKKIQSLLEKQ